MGLIKVKLSRKYILTTFKIKKLNPSNPKKNRVWNRKRGGGNDIDFPVPVGCVFAQVLLLLLCCEVVCLCGLAGNAEDKASLVPASLFIYQHICSRRIPTTTLQNIGRVGPPRKILGREERKKRRRPIKKRDRYSQGRRLCGIVDGLDSSRTRKRNRRPIHPAVLGVVRLRE